MGTYLGAVDLVTQNQLTIIARIGVNPSDRMLGDVSPALATIFVNNSSTVSRQVGSQVTAEFNISKSVVDNIGGIQRFVSNDAPISFYSGTPDGTANFNKTVGLNFGTIATTVTNFSSQLFNTPGVYSWTVPDGVTSISVAGVGGGGGGTQKSAGGSGGGGGLVSYSNSVAVTPGTTCTIVVGAGGVTGGTYGLNGSSTYMLLPGSNVPIVLAQGGAGGDGMFWLSGSQSVVVGDYTATISVQTAFDPVYRPITYSISSGSLPTGASFNTSTGALSWVSQGIIVDTEYTPFTISASNGVQTISKPFTIKIIRQRYVFGTYAVIAGGGSGGAYYYGGGGGAGGLLTNSGGAIVVFAPGVAYTITVGAGGAGGSAAATNGNDSSIVGTALSVTATGGGHGGNAYNAQSYSATTTGGSGGGGSSNGNSSGAAGVAGQGNIGGSGTTNQMGGGGGGSGGAGRDGTVGSGPAPSGVGGTGTDLSSIISTTLATSSGVGYVSGAQVQFAGGGGAGADGNAGSFTYQAQGSAGGGQGGAYTSGTPVTDGQTYTGSGGGGACHLISSNSAGGSGGKGVVIIRYASTGTLATGGDVININISTGYVTHIFKNSGIFTPSSTV